MTGEIFGGIYDRGEWGNDGSGQGSNPSAAESYLPILQHVVSNVRSVVDVGCGDWQFSRHVDWTGIRYLGLDVVSSVIEQNRARFAQPGIQFECVDVLVGRPPRADLLVCKDV